MPFIHLACPSNPYKFYFLIFGLDHDDFRHGVYLGEIVCPSEYPLKPPKINLLTENGRFHIRRPHGICLSMSQYHPEQWKPVWSIQTVILGLISFWLDKAEPHTAGAVLKNQIPKDMPLSLFRRQLANQSGQKVLENEIFKQVFGPMIQELGSFKLIFGCSNPAQISFNSSLSESTEKM